MTHVDLFTGIGGFSLAASWCGVRTVAQVEIEPHCMAFLAGAWPDTEKHDDIRTFDGRRYEGAFILTAGVPCQPASRAGQQKGSDDDRWLWPEALRVLGEVRPAWAIFENPPGIGDVGLSGILADVEAHGYEVRVFGIPACAVGSPQRRERYWIVAHARRGCCEGRAVLERPSGHDEAERGSQAKDDQRCDSLHMAHAPEPGREGAYTESGAYGRGAQCAGGDVAHAEAAARLGLQDREKHGASAPHGRCDAGPWGDFVWLPCADGKVRRAPGDAVGVVDGLHRSVLAALGNSIVPQVAARLIAAMVEAKQPPLFTLQSAKGVV
jgi:DNA (cytosine-5)-methyltransferase 1